MTDKHLHLKSLLAAHNEYRLLALMLLALHIAMWGDLAGAASRSLMLAHLGLFLLWQPIWSREQRMQASGATISVLAILAFVSWLDWWAVTIWLLLLTGLIGGRTTSAGRDRFAYMLTLVFLVLELLLGAIPETFAVTLPALPRIAAAWGLLIAPLTLLFLSAPQDARIGSQATDFLYGVMLSLLIGVLGLGALLRMYDVGVTYADALFQTTFAVAGFMLAISWLWMPFAGFSGLGQLWTRYLMNIGTPFEQWLERIATLSHQRRRPDEFLKFAMRELVGLPWVRGVSWTIEPGSTQREGEVSDHSFSVVEESLQATVYMHAPAGTSLLLHGRLLVALLAQFYDAKQQEAELRRRAHLEAVHETGARVTHDIKNLLQALHSLASAMTQAKTTKAREAAHELVERLMPLLSTSLENALDKLQKPELNIETWIGAVAWWGTVKQRHGQDSVSFCDNLGDIEVRLPSAMFNSVLENLLENAFYKRKTEPDITIAVKLWHSRDKLSLTVTDSGSAIDSITTADLLTGPVRSRSGFGIGLYQAKRLAQLQGFNLALSDNRAGHVQFSLTRKATD